jgi:hypothetical protein
MTKYDTYLINRYKDVPWHMTPIDCQIAILDKLRSLLPMCEISLSSGTAKIGDLYTGITKATYFLIKKPSN